MKNMVCRLSVFLVVADIVPEAFCGVVSNVVETASPGSATLVCEDVRDWAFELSSHMEDGCDIVDVSMRSSDESVPPAFTVSFKMSGADVHHVWTADYKADATRLWMKGWKGPFNYASQLASVMPIAVGFNQNDESRISIACSETMHRVDFDLGTEACTSDIIGCFSFFRQGAAALREYHTSIRIDRRRSYWANAVRQATDWIVRTAGVVPAAIPNSAFDPLYSTWYAYWQDVRADELEQEARLAADFGMKTMILDDGWQKTTSKSCYSATGDWMPVQSRFPDMRAHVDAVHRAGLKYMLWLSVPYVGSESKAWERFRGKVIKMHGTDPEKGFHAVLDPRFPEVREYLLQTYERVVRDWDFDGVKLDFIDQFTLPEIDPAEKENFVGRDIRSLPLAVDRLMKDIVIRLTALKPGVLIEFRQNYIGPSILQYGNMIRAADCPSEPDINRKRIANLRLTSGKAAVHADMLVWNAAETPEGAAKPILSALFGTIQYSMILSKLSESHRAVVRHWIDFSERHRKTLLQSAFRPHHPELNYPFLEAESADECICAVYASEWVVKPGCSGKKTYIINATDAGTIVYESTMPGRVAQAYDTFGKSVVGKHDVKQGLNRITVPPSGFLVVE